MENKEKIENKKKSVGSFIEYDEEETPPSQKRIKAFLKFMKIFFIALLCFTIVQIIRIIMILN